MQLNRASLMDKSGLFVGGSQQHFLSTFALPAFSPRYYLGVFRLHILFTLTLIQWGQEVSRIWRYLQGTNSLSLFVLTRMSAYVLQGQHTLALSSFFFFFFFFFWFSPFYWTLLLKHYFYKEGFKLSCRCSSFDPLFKLQVSCLCISGLAFISSESN